MHSEGQNPSPGEARTRRRIRKQWIYLGLAALLGGLLGGVIAGSDSGGGSLFLGDYADLRIDPVLALVLAGGFLFAFVLLPLWGFTQIDELQREQNLLAFTGGCLAVLGCFPIWAMLHAGGHAGPPDAFGLYLVAFGAMAASFLFVKLRS